MKKAAIPFLIILLTLFIACGGDDNGTDGNGTPTVTRLVADTLAQPSMTDVNVGWSGVDSAMVEIGGSTIYGINPNLGKQNMILKAIVKNNILYIRAKWHDANANIWGNYIRRTNLEGNFEQNTYEGEDKLLFLFDAQNNGTEKADCASMCHVTEHYTTGGGNADAWKWLATKTSPGWMGEDEWWNNSDRLLDARQPNMYVYRENWNSQTKHPYWMHTDGPDFTEPFLYLEDTATFNPLNPGWATGDRIPGYAIDSTIYKSGARTLSSVWDIAAISHFDSSGEVTSWSWTVVMARALNTGHADDVNLSSLDSVQIAVAATNNDAVDATTAHSGSKPFYLILKP
ncbi:MAG: ethylbenzene dehydrogenase-related protein [Candidatus Zixiibacteriota bacterium]